MKNNTPDGLVHALYTGGCGKASRTTSLCDLWDMTIPACEERNLRKVRKRATTCLKCLLICCSQPSMRFSVGVICEDK
jgi:hypothetical protein